MKFLKVNMTTGDITVENVTKEYEGLGGRGLTSVMINREVPPDCDPLGPDNKLIFAPGLLTGTPLVNTSRISIGAKSPLTKGIKESNAGGTVSAAIAKHGITAIVIEGKPRENSLYLLKIDKDGNASLESGDTYKKMRTYALVEKLLDEHGEKNGILCIGPAGEYQMESASIQSSDADGRPCRAAGRGGLGAVMGAKGLKAIIVNQEGKNADNISDPETFKEAAKAFVEVVKKNPFCSKTLPTVGTASMVSAVNAMGAFPTRNATKGTMEGFEKISGENMAKLIKERGGKVGHRGCSQCIIRCSNEFVDKNGKYVTGSLEYETIWSMGGMTEIDDLDTIAKLDFLADDIGLDSMNAGVAIAVAMDAGYKEFGDGQAAIDMLEEIAKGSELGMVLGHGPAAVGKHFNHSRVPVVKNQSIAAYDPRGMQGNGVTYSTSPMGADHTAGNLVGRYLIGALNPLETDGQVQASREAQIENAYLDITGLCLFAGGPMAHPKGSKAMTTMINAKLGTQLGSEEMIKLGEKVIMVEQEFNQKAGLTREDDRLPAFFKNEPLPPHNKVFAISDADMDTTFDF